jgi:hypothetical protein
MTTETQLQQILDRVVRTESRLCRVADHIGLDVRSDNKNLRILDNSADAYVSVSCTAMDVGYTKVINFLHKEGIEDKVANVYFGSRLIARIYPLEK